MEILRRYSCGDTRGEPANLRLNAVHDTWADDYCLFPRNLHQNPPLLCTLFNTRYLVPGTGTRQLLTYVQYILRSTVLLTIGDATRRDSTTQDCQPPPTPLMGATTTRYKLSASSYLYIADHSTSIPSIETARPPTIAAFYYAVQNRYLVLVLVPCLSFLQHYSCMLSSH